MSQKRNPGENRVVQPTTQYKAAEGYKLVDNSILNNVLTFAVCCVKCKCKQMCFKEYTGKQNGLSQFKRVTCKNCGMSKNFKRSKRVKGFSEVNVRGVLVSQPVGRAGLEKFCGIMNLPDPPNQSIYNNIHDRHFWHKAEAYRECCYK